MTVQPKLALGVVLSTLGYLALAAFAFGGFAAFFANPARTTLAIATVLMGVAALFTRASLSAGVREDRGNRWVLSAFGVLGLLSALVPPYADRHEIWTLDGDAVRWLGVAVYVVGGVLRMWPVFVLWHRFSGLVAIQPDHELVTGGIYRVIRHPSYLGLLMIAIGWALVFRSVIGLLLAALLIVPLIARIHAEERLLRSQFGDAYDAYRARTSRLIPGLY
jgi:protein-S-isoprenylcysteine O-methyltransferase Ste14